MKIGTMLSEVAFSNFPVILKNCGFDFVLVDTEHGAFDYSTLLDIAMKSKLAGLDCIVRLPDNSRRDITKMMDGGMTGLLLPMTNTPEDIKQVVKYAKYAPVGERGISTTRIHTLYNPPKLELYMKQANEYTKIYAQIETVKGVENCYDIMSVEGVEGAFMGPNDLSCDLGILGGDQKPLYDAIVKMGEAAKKAGKPWGIITTKQELIDFAKENGATLLSYGSELNMMIDSAKKIVKEQA